MSGQFIDDKPIYMSGTAVLQSSGTLKLIPFEGSEFTVLVIFLVDLADTNVRLDTKGDGLTITLKLYNFDSATLGAGNTYPIEIGKRGKNRILMNVANQTIGKGGQGIHVIHYSIYDGGPASD